MNTLLLSHLGRVRLVSLAEIAYTRSSSLDSLSSSASCSTFNSLLASGLETFSLLGPNFRSSCGETCLLGWLAAYLPGLAQGGTLKVVEISSGIELKISLQRTER